MIHVFGCIFVILEDFFCCLSLVDWVELNINVTDLIKNRKTFPFDFKMATLNKI